MSLNGNICIVELFDEAAADRPVAEHAFHGLPLRYGDGESVGFAVGPRGKVEVNGLRGSTRAPARAGVVATGESVPEVATDGVEITVAAAVLPPRSVREGRFAVDDDGIGFGHEFVATIPTAVASADVAQLGAGGIDGNSKGNSK